MTSGWRVTVFKNIHGAVDFIQSVAMTSAQFLIAVSGRFSQDLAGNLRFGDVFADFVHFHDFRDV